MTVVPSCYNLKIELCAIIKKVKHSLCECFFESKENFMAKEIIDGQTMTRALTRITYEIIERNKGIEDLVLVGIKTRGVFVAHRIESRLKQLENINIPVAELDITPYRDDQTHEEKDISKVKTEPLNIDINNKHVILTDDVLYTGRTIRAAMDALMSAGRPKKISLAVLVDRGHRELPIRADFVGKNIPTSQKEKIKVSMKEIDGEDKIEIE